VRALARYRQLPAISAKTTRSFAVTSTPMIPGLMLIAAALNGRRLSRSRRLDNPKSGNLKLGNPKLLDLK
ncbi:MAG: hypothetical protein ACXV8M_11430, partial [Candidatus Angelobacter sp.]